MPSNADRALLFGILALQNSFITREQLLAGFDAESRDKSRSLGEHLVTLSALKPTRLAVLNELVTAHIEQHGGDPAQSLAGLSSAQDAQAALASYSDSDLQASLRRVPLRASPIESGSDFPTAAAPAVDVAGGRFRILRPHAHGGLGRICVALDQELNREVALKDIRTEADDGQARNRFVLEAEITGGLEHPNIVPVYSLGKYADGRPSYAMKFIQGTSLYDAVKKFHGAADESGRIKPRRFDNPTANLELRQLMGRLVDVCHAIAYAHSRGVLHRDLKPGNIMLGQYGETLVVDWGLAKALGEAPESLTESSTPLKPSTLGSGSFEQTMPGNIVGTPQYMSPEQAAGKLDELGPATDVYAIGATLYNILTGQAPVTGETLEDILRQVREGTIIHVQSLNPTVPRPIADACHKALEILPRHRFESAKLLAEELERWLADDAQTRDLRAALSAQEALAAEMTALAGRESAARRGRANTTFKLR